MWDIGQALAQAGNALSSVDSLVRTAQRTAERDAASFIAACARHTGLLAHGLRH